MQQTHSSQRKKIITFIQTLCLYFFTNFKYLYNSAMNKRLHSLVSLSLVTLPVSLSASCASVENSKTIRAQGSSTVLPIIGELESQYQGRFQYTPTGSGSAFNLINQTTNSIDVAFTSSSKIPAEGQWKNPNLRTLTYALDAIVLIVHLPKELKTIKNEPPILNFEYLVDVYLGKKVFWSQLVMNLEPTKSLKTVIPFGRIGGKSQSGSAEAFIEKLIDHRKFDNVEDILNHNVLEPENKTVEPNSIVHNLVNDKEGSISYISLGYALQNITENVQLASISKGNSIWVPTVENVQNKTYKFVRPLNVIFDVNTQKSVLLVKNLLGDNFQESIRKKGFIPLSEHQKKIQQPLSTADKDFKPSNKEEFKTLNDVVFGLDV